MGQILVFVTQLGKIAFVEGLLLIAFRNGAEFQQTSLSHEDGFNLKQVVTVFAYGTQGNVACPCLEGLAIDAKAVVTCQCLEIGVLPRAVTLLSPLLYGNGFLLQSFGLQGCHP